MLVRSLVSVAVMAGILGTILFVSAGTFHYPQAWLYLALSIASQAFIVIDLARRDPELLARRRKAGSRHEGEPTQKRIIRLLVIVGTAVPAIAGWDYRLGWSQVPLWLMAAGALLFVAGQAGIVWVFRSNTYARATVEVSEGQTIVENGPYALVRHPMYSAMLLITTGMALMLGSWWAFADSLLMAPILAWRLLDEERVMLRDLPAYAAYRDKVRKRLLPGLW